MTYTTAPKVDDRHNVTLLVTKVFMAAMTEFR